MNELTILTAPPFPLLWVNSKRRILSVPYLATYFRATSDVLSVLPSLTMITSYVKCGSWD